MSKIIHFNDNPVSELKKKLEEKEQELEIAKQELIFFKNLYKSTISIGDLLKTQITDLHSNIILLRGHLKVVQENLDNMKNKINDLDKMHLKVQVIKDEESDE